jgi:porin
MLCILCFISFCQINLSQNDSSIQKTFGFQDSLSKRGIDFGAAYAGEYFSNLSGGIQRKGTYLDNYIFTLGFDLEKLINANGMTAYFSGLGINGGLPLENSGTLQGISNIAGVNHWKLYEAWIEQNFFDDEFSILLGLYDLNSEFDVRESSGIFLNPSFGIGFDFSQSGQNGPSIFPYTSLAFRLKVSLSKSLELIAAAFDGVPGSLAGQKDFLHLSWNEEEGALLAAEVILIPAEKEFGECYSKFSFGGWYYTSDFENVVSEKKQQGNFGIYLNAEQFLFAENFSSQQGLALFGRFGFANSTFNPSDYSILGGANYKGLFPGRDEDVLGLAFTSIHLTDEFKNSEQFKSNLETIIEVTYSIKASNWLKIQPDLQLIFNPILAPQSDHSIAAGLRTEISF